MEILVMVFWVLSPCNVVIAYQRFGNIHLQGEDFMRNVTSP